MLPCYESAQEETSVHLPPDLQQTYADETAERTVIALERLLIIDILLFPLFIVLDFIMFRPLAWQLGQVRLLTMPVFIACLATLVALRRHGSAERFVRLVALVAIYTTVFSLDAIIVIAGGATSPYYAGLCLVPIALYVAMPWPPRELIAHTGFIWAQYVAVMVLCDYLGDHRVGLFQASPAGRHAWESFIGNNFFMVSMLVIGLGWAVAGHNLRMIEFRARHALRREKERSEQLLLNIMPAPVAEELKLNGRVEAREIPDCSIMFTDFVGFTQIASRTAPAALVRSLDKLFVGFDQIIARHGLEKLKTIGDAYMCAGGIPGYKDTHLIDCVLAALEILAFLDRYREENPEGVKWQVRIGIHSGPVTAGVIGRARFAYDVWGDTVNTASRLESASEVGRINLTTDTYRLIAHLFNGHDRGYLPVKGKGLLAMTFVTGLQPGYAEDHTGRRPNPAFRDAYLRQKERKTPLPPPQAPLRFAPEERWFGKESYLVDVLGQLIHLQEQDKAEIRQKCVEVPFKAREVLVAQGSRLDSLLVVLEGHVGVQAALTNGYDTSHIDVSILGPGDLVGEMSFVTGEPASASVVSVEPGRLLRVPRLALDGLTRFDPGFGARLFRSLSSLLAHRLRDTTARLPALMVEEVAQVKLHHSMLTGRLADDAVPPPLREMVETFKAGMLEMDKQLALAARRGESEALRPEAQRRVEELCEGLVAVLTTVVMSERDTRRADGYGAFTLRETFPYIMKSRFCDRCFSKPRGYAGDFSTIELIHQNQPSGDGRLGPLIDAWFLAQPPARAVRARRVLIRDLLLERHATHGQVSGDERFRILALGAGSARELFDMFQQIKDPRHLLATCLDVDVEALAYSAHLAREQGLEERFLWAKENVLRLGRSRGTTRPAPQNVIYSVGLFDYLKDEIVVQVLNWIHATLAPGGQAIVGNFDVNCKGRAFLDYVLDWRLLYRTPEQMQELFARSAFGQGPGRRPTEVRWEETHINHFIVAERAPE